MEIGIWGGSALDIYSIILYSGNSVDMVRMLLGHIDTVLKTG
jgi:hypothetical protein